MLAKSIPQPFCVAASQASLAGVGPFGRSNLLVSSACPDCAWFSPPPSRGRLGGGWGRSHRPTHPHPSPPLEGEGADCSGCAAMLGRRTSLCLDSAKQADRAWFSPPPSRGRLGGGCRSHRPTYPHPSPPLEGEGADRSGCAAMLGRRTSLRLDSAKQADRAWFSPPPSRGRLGGGWGKGHCPTHPHPGPPLEGEGAVQCKK